MLTYTLNNLPTAVTLIESLPSNTNMLSVTGKAILSGYNQSIAHLSTCTSTNSKTANTDCSYIQVSNATYACASNVTTQTAPMNCSMSADIVGFDLAQVDLTSYTAHETYFNTMSLVVSPDSVVTFTGTITVDAEESAGILGILREYVNTDDDGIVPQSYLSELRVKAGINATLSSVHIDRILVSANNIFLPPSSIVENTGYTDNVCAEPVTASLLSCNYTGGVSGYDRLLIFDAEADIIVGYDTIMTGSLMFFCGRNINFQTNSFLSANFSGCAANEGLGPGLMSSNIVGGGGGANGGSGGVGTNNPNSGGTAYAVSNNGLSTMIYSGSGGGCFGASGTPSSCMTSYGGGIISIQATNQLTLYGNITANGGSAQSSNGGGAGGSIAVL
ncbi:hypothetical protein EON64_13740, partial [archaeon]